MKRMNEYFETPITGIAFRGLCQAHLFDAEVDDMVAHAINNVDVLADALEDLVNDIENNLNPRYSFEQAVTALNAYRGAK